MMCVFKKVLLGIMMVLCMVFQIGIASAETKEIISVGTYVMGDGETPTIAEERALMQAKRGAVEQAGTYVQSFSKVKNYRLTEDEVTVLASGIIEVQVIDKSRLIVGNGIEFWVKIRAVVNSDKIQNMAERVRDRESNEDYQKLKEENTRNEQLIVQLKRQLQGSTIEGDRGQIQNKLYKVETSFSARYWFDKGKSQELGGDYILAVESYSKAIELNRKYPQAYYRRGEVFTSLGQFDKARSDYNTAENLVKNPPIVRAFRTFMEIINVISNNGVTPRNK